jgi:hypothetical protein
VLACLAIVSPAGAAGFTWRGGDAGANWSAADNWIGGAGPAGTVDTLDFPLLSGAGCSASPATSTCYQSRNDSDPTANAITIDDGAGYAIGGDTILLGAGGLVAAPSAPDAEPDRAA